MLAILGALKEEIGSLKRGMNIETGSPGDCVVCRGSLGGADILLVRTGIGRERAERAAELVTGRFPVSALVSFGFGGALAEDLKTGDLALGAELCAAGEEGLLHPDSALLSLSMQVSPDIRRARFVTVPGITATPPAKRALAASTGADIADMETYWIARLASEKNVPFLAVRSVFDTVGASLAPFEGSYNRRGVVSYFASQPWRLGGLPRLYRDMLRAQASLNRFITAFAASYASLPLAKVAWQ